MYFYKTLILIVCLFLFSCEKNEVVDVQSQIQSLSLDDAIFKHVSNQHFLTDFICQKNMDAPLVSNRPYSKLIRTSGLKDLEKLEAYYPTALAEIKKIVDSNNPSLHHIIQEVTLRYMRNLFIPRDGETATLEVEKLFRMVMKTNPIDLDVLTDAYLKIENQLTKSERTTYYNQLEAIFVKHQNYMEDRFIKVEKKLNDAVTEKEKRAAFMAGKRLERLSKSCAYSDEKLDFSRN